MNVLSPEFGVGRALVRCGDDNHPTWVEQGDVLSRWYMLLSEMGLVRIVGQRVEQDDELGTLWCRTRPGDRLAAWLQEAS